MHRVLPLYHMGQVVRAGLTDGIVTDVARSFAVLGAWSVGAWMVMARVVGKRG